MYLYMIYVFLYKSLSPDNIFRIFLLKLNQWRSIKYFI